MKNLLMILVISSPFLIFVAIVFIINKFHENKHLRKCPYCKEMIKKEALKCKHCYSDLRGK